MFFHVIAESGIGQALLAGEKVESAFPGHDPDRYDDLAAARHACPKKDWLVVQAFSTHRRNGNGDPLFRIELVPPPGGG